MKLSKIIFTLLLFLVVVGVFRLVIGTGSPLEFQDFIQIISNGGQYFKFNDVFHHFQELRAYFDCFRSYIDPQQSTVPTLNTTKPDLVYYSPVFYPYTPSSRATPGEGFHGGGEFQFYVYNVDGTIYSECRYQFVGVKGYRWEGDIWKYVQEQWRYFWEQANATTNNIGMMLSVTFKLIISLVYESFQAIFGLTSIVLDLLFYVPSR